MQVINTNIPEVKIIEPKIFGDDRGYFFESFSDKWFRENVCDTTFVQDNESKSKYGVLRGLHFQKTPYEQAKLIRVVSGAVLDVCVDLRENSPTFGKHVAIEISSENKRQVFIPRGFAHGFVVLSNEVVFQYKCDNYYVPESEGGIMWNDISLGINWEIAKEDIILSEKDKHHPTLSEYLHNEELKK